MTTDETTDVTSEPEAAAEPPRADTPWEAVEPTVEVVPAPVHPSPSEPVPAAPAPEAVGVATADADAPTDEPVDEEAASLAAIPAGSGGWWTIPTLCLGVAIIACALVIPAADENRRVAYESEKLKADLAHLERQISVNDEFLRRLADDPNLSERLARRQMKMVREGTNVLELKGEGGRAADASLSPFLLVNIAPPSELPPYQPMGGFLADLFQHPKTQLYLMGAGLLMVAGGLVLGQGVGEGLGGKAEIRSQKSEIRRQNQTGV